MKASKIPRWTAWVPALVWMGIIFYLSSLPTVLPLPSPLLDLVVKKSSHMIGYGVLAWFYYLGLTIAGRVPPEEAMPWTWGMALFYAATDEFHQGFVPGRHSSPLDVIIDGTGAILGLLLVRWVASKHREFSARRSTGESTVVGKMSR